MLQGERGSTAAASQDTTSVYHVPLSSGYIFPGSGTFFSPLCINSALRFCSVLLVKHSVEVFGMQHIWGRVSQFGLVLSIAQDTQVMLPSFLLFMECKLERSDAGFLGLTVMFEPQAP